MFRFLAVAIFLILFLILTIPLMIIEWFIGKVNPSLRDTSSLAIVSWGFKAVRFLSGTELIILGREIVPDNEAVVYMGNHRSFFDVVFTYPLVKGPTGYVAKKEIKKVPLLNVWMNRLHCLFLDRKDIKQGLQIILEAIEYVKSGISICIFPEGTRNKDAQSDELLEFHEGSFKIATKSKSKIIPMTIVGTNDVFEDHIPFIKKRRVVIEYGTPIDTTLLSKEELKVLSTTVHDVIYETYKKNKAAYFN